jgi:hypothetical protein
MSRPIRRLVPFDRLSPYFLLPHARCWRLAPVWFQALVVAVPGPVVLVFAFAVRRELPTRGDLAAVLGVALILFLGILLLNQACRATVRTFRDCSTAVLPRKQAAFASNFDRRFDCRIQRIVAGVFGIVGIALTFWLQPAISATAYWIFIVQALVAWPLNGFGLAFAISQLRWLRSVSHFRGLTVNPIPAETHALRSAAGLGGLIALLFSIQLGAEIAVFFVIDWQNTLAVDAAIFALMMPLGVLAFGLLASPQMAFFRRVNAEKNRALLRVEQELRSAALCAETSRSDFHPQRIDLIDFQTKLARSPSTPTGASTWLQYGPSAALACVPLLLEPADIRSFFARLLGLL